MWCGRFFSRFFYCSFVLQIASTTATKSGMNMKFFIRLTNVSDHFFLVRRSDWLARPPIGELPLGTPVPYVVLKDTEYPYACSNKDECSAAMRQLQNMDMDDDGLWDIAYNFGVGADGAVYEARGWKTVGTHSLHLNSISIGICLIGRWKYKVPPERQLEATRALIASGVQMGFIKPTYKLLGHRQVMESSSPGQALYREIQTWEHYSPIPSSPKDLAHVEDLPDSVKELFKNECYSVEDETIRS